MFENQQSFIMKHSTTSNSYDRQVNSVVRADHAFRRAITIGKVLCFVRSLLGLPNQMLDLWETSSRSDIITRRYEGTRTVPIDKIRGTESRSADFDCSLYPTHWRSRERWVNVAAIMLRDEALPAVELVQVGDSYFIRDGHHRVSAAKMLSQLDIDADVTVWQQALPAAEMARPDTVNAHGTA